MNRIARNTATTGASQADEFLRRARAVDAYTTAARTEDDGCCARCRDFDAAYDAQAHADAEATARMNRRATRRLQLFPGTPRQAVNS